MAVSIQDVSWDFVPCSINSNQRFELVLTTHYSLCFLFVEIRTMDKVQKLNSNECYKCYKKVIGH
jgi:hypothetical protein